jgi:uncharacterized protein YdhG (YjbR/CyaY superfamily)
MRPLLKPSNEISGYIATFPKEVQETLKKLREIIKESAPEAQQSISYQMPTFKLNGKNLVHFAAFKKHIGFYPTPSGISSFAKELAQYKGAKGSVQFPLDKPIPFNLIRKIVKFRAKELTSKKPAHNKYTDALV